MMDETEMDDDVSGSSPIHSSWSLWSGIFESDGGFAHRHANYPWHKKMRRIRSTSSGDENNGGVFLGGKTQSKNKIEGIFEFLTSCIPARSFTSMRILPSFAQESHQRGYEKSLSFLSLPTIFIFFVASLYSFPPGFS